MKETIQSLLKLAQIDNKLDHFIREQEDIPESVRAISIEIVSLQNEADAKQKEFHDLENQKKEIQSFLQEKKQWIIDREARINELTTTKEYQAALKEVSLGKKEIKDKETILEALLPKLGAYSTEGVTTVEKLNAKIVELKNSIQQSKECFETLQTSIAEEKLARKQAVQEVTNKQALHHYEQIRRRVSPAISKAEDRICVECGTRILPQVYNLLTVGQSIQSCNGCKRILYIPD